MDTLPSTTDCLTKAKALLSEAGLTFPFIPNKLALHFKQWGPWSFSTRSPLRLSPYAFDHYVIEGTADRIEDYMLLAHAGHGANSYAIHYYLVSGPLRVFLQLGYGGIYSDDNVCARLINDSFELVSRLVAGAHVALAMKRLLPCDQLLIAGSALYGAYWKRPGGRKTRAPSECPLLQQPVYVLEKAVKWVETLN